MKRFVGLILAIAGGIVVLWGGISALTGSLKKEVAITHDVSVNALTGGLIGLAVLVVGLMWVRE